jgi:hypothetical protein
MRLWLAAAAVIEAGTVLAPAPAAADPPGWRHHDRHDRGGRHDDYRGYGGGYGYDPYAHNGSSDHNVWYWGSPPRNRWEDSRPGYRRLPTASATATAFPEAMSSCP